ncbi:hypothetical protein M3Y99_01230900 [Aphelenchoides fujianensis]|nr:hypothetical protein M3Y99_01230900 [Aphelenchoides fujianensis]
MSTPSQIPKRQRLPSVSHPIAVETLATLDEQDETKSRSMDELNADAANSPGGFDSKLPVKMDGLEDLSLPPVHLEENGGSRLSIVEASVIIANPSGGALSSDDEQPEVVVYEDRIVALNDVVTSETTTVVFRVDQNANKPPAEFVLAPDPELPPAPFVWENAPPPTAEKKSGGLLRRVRRGFRRLANFGRRIVSRKKRSSYDVITPPQRPEISVPMPVDVEPCAPSTSGLPLTYTVKLTRKIQPPSSPPPAPPVQLEEAAREEEATTN